MSTIAARKCVRHIAREAVACCPSCHEHFCRECVVEHAGVLLCAACLAQATKNVATSRSTDWHRVGTIAVTASCVLLLWVVFYGFGQLLKSIPPQVHEGTVWKKLVKD